MNRILRRAAFSLQLSAISFAVPAYADLVRLANGNGIEGILLSETPEQVEVQFAAGGSITFHREEILSIEPSDEGTRHDLLVRWTKDQEAFKEELKQQKAYEAAQREKGLIPDGSEWVSREEYAARTEREKLDLEARKVDSQRAGTRELAQAVASAAQPAAKTESMDLSKPIAPGIVISYPFWDWRGQPVYRTFPVVNNQPPHRHPRPEKGREKRPEMPALSLYQQATSRVFNSLLTTPRGALAP